MLLWAFLYMFLCGHVSIFLGYIQRVELLGPMVTPYLTFFKIFYLFIFIEKGREGERKGEKHQCVVASHAPHIGVGPGQQPGRVS